MLTAFPHFFSKEGKSFWFQWCHLAVLISMKAQIWRWWECVGPQWVKLGISCCGCTDNEGRKHPGGGRGELRWELRHYRLVLPVYKSLWHVLSAKVLWSKILESVQVECNVLFIQVISTSFLIHKFLVCNQKCMQSRWNRPTGDA